jgi:hypothetical protein
MAQRKQTCVRAVFLTTLCLVASEGDARVAQDTTLWKPRLLGGGETPLPARIAQADLVVVGRLSGVEDNSLEAEPVPGSAGKVAYRVLGMKLEEVLLGDKAAKKIRVGFIPKSAPSAPPPQLFVLKEGWEGLLFLKKHHQGDFYVTFALFSNIARGAPEFAKTVEDARKLAKIMHNPAAALKADNASNRYLAAAMLIDKFRPTPLKGQPQQEEPIDPEVSKLLLKALAEADWKYDADWTGVYPPHPYDLFQQLGVSKADGYQPPTGDSRDTLAATQKWLLDHQGKYKVKHLTPKSK